MGMLLLTLFKTQLSLAAASSVMFLSTVRQVELDVQEQLLEIEAAEVAPKPAPVIPQEKEEEK